jgi:hypothetical protein
MADVDVDMVVVAAAVVAGAVPLLVGTVVGVRATGDIWWSAMSGWSGGPDFFTAFRGIGRMGTERFLALGTVLAGSGVTEFNAGCEGDCDCEGAALTVFLAFRAARWYFDSETDS